MQHFQNHPIYLDMLNKQLQFFQDMLKSAGVTVDKSLNNTDKSMTLLSVLNTHFQDGPVLGPLPNLKQLTYSNDDEYLIPRIAVNLYNKKALVQFLTLVIRRQIEKVAVPFRSFWTCDTSRNNFHVREDNNGEKVWTIDKGGKKIIKEVINPVIEIVKKLVRDYADNEHDECLEMITNDIENNPKYNQHEMGSSRGDRICRAIFMGSIQAKVLHELSNNYYMNYDKINQYIKTHELDKIDKEIGENPEVIKALKQIEDEYKKDNVRYNKPLERKWMTHKKMYGDFDDPNYEHKYDAENDDSDGYKTESDTDYYSESDS